MIYLDIVRFSFLRFFTYPFEILASVAKRVIEILFLILFWSLIVKSSEGQINIPQIVSYFFISMGIRDLVMSHWGPFGGEIGNQIKTGKISAYMIKPISLIPFLYSLSFGRNGMRVFLAVINLAVGIIIFPPKSLIAVLLFIIFFICAWMISFSYNLLQGSLYFYLTEAGGVRSALNNLIRVFSGEMVPIFLFPLGLRQIVRLTPFPGMVYGPTIALSTNYLTYDVAVDLMVAVFWAISLNIAAYLFWQKSIKTYEAVGI